MTRHEVTLAKGIVPPGSVYHQACQSKQLVPPRYTKFFSEGNCFLPDSTALELINKRCHFCRKRVTIFAPQFRTFLHNAKHKRNNLANLFKDVESLTIRDYMQSHWTFGHGAEAVTSFGEIPSKLLGLIFSNTNPKLATLSIGQRMV